MPTRVVAVEVQPCDVEGATRYDSYACPVGRAILRTTRRQVGVCSLHGANPKFMHVDPATGAVRYYQMPPHVAEYARRFDANQSPALIRFVFELEVP